MQTLIDTLDRFLFDHFNAIVAVIVSGAAIILIASMLLICQDAYNYLRKRFWGNL